MGNASTQAGYDYYSPVMRTIESLRNEGSGFFMLLQSLTINGKTVPLETEIGDPEGAQNVRISVPGVLQHYMWGGEPTDDMELTEFYVGPKGFAIIDTWIKSADAINDIEVAPEIYMVNKRGDVTKHIYGDSAPIKGKLIKNKCAISNTDESEALGFSQSELYRARLVFTGNDAGPQDICVDYADNDKSIRVFGTTIGAS